MACLLLSAGIPSAGYAEYKVGDTVSDFTLPDLDGNQVTLSDYSGRLVLLNFFTTT